MNLLLLRRPQVSLRLSSLPLRAPTCRAAQRRVLCAQAPPPLSPPQHLPPLPVRVGLVATTVGLGTPFFAVGGAARLWYSYAPRSAAGQAAKWALSLVGGGGCVHLIYEYVIPLLRHHSDFVLPFALSNAVASGFWYVVGEASMGLPFMTGAVTFEALQHSQVGRALALILRLMGQSATTGVLFHTSLPVGGVFVGALTALTAPILWPAAFHLCWDDNTRVVLLGEHGTTWLVELYTAIALPVGLPTGIFAGVGLHLALHSFITGAPGVPWAARSLPVLLALGTAAGTYFAVFRPPQHEYTWMGRLDAVSGEWRSVNVTTGAVLLDGGTQASVSELERAFAFAFQALRNPLRALGLAGDKQILQANAEAVGAAWRDKRYASTSAAKHAERQVQGLRPADPLSDASRFSVKRTPITAANIDRCGAVYRVVDMLVRLKQLEQEKARRARPDAEVDADVEQLLAIAASDGIRDLADLAVAADRAVVAVRAWKKHPSQDRYEVVVKLQKEIADNIPLPPKQTFVESLFKDPPKPKQHQGLQMLPYNTDVYEEEMLREVGYRVAETAAAEAAVLTNYAVERFGRATADALRPVFIGGAIAGGLYFLATAVFDRK